MNDASRLRESERICFDINVRPEALRVQLARAIGFALNSRGANETSSCVAVRSRPVRDQLGVQLAASIEEQNNWTRTSAMQPHDFGIRHIEWITRLPRSAQAGLSLGALSFVILIDWLAGHDVSVSFFYLPPVVLMTWAYGMLAGFVLALACAMCERILLAPYGHGFQIALWNTGIRFLTYAAFVWMIDSLKEHLNRERALSRVDYLTGIGNSRHFHERAEIELKRSSRTGGRIAVACLDLDDFKQVNDRFGHFQGDELLRLVAKVLKENTRATDVVARLGGDEFGILLTDTDPDELSTVLTKIHDRIMELAGTTHYPVSSSIGACVMEHADNDVDALLACADDLLYEAKDAGKNRLRLKQTETCSA